MTFNLYLMCFSRFDLARPASNGWHPLSPFPCCPFPTAQEAPISSSLLTSKRWTERGKQYTKEMHTAMTTLMYSTDTAVNCS